MSKYNNIVFLVAGIIFFLVRLTGDLLLYSLDMTKGNEALYWYLITTTAIFLSFGIYYFKSVTDKKDFGSDNNGDVFLNSTYQTFVLSIIIVLLVIFFSFKDTSVLFKRSYIGLILADFFFIYTVIVILINLQYAYKWLLHRRHRLTRFYLFLLGFFILMILSNDVATHFLDSGISGWLQIITTFFYLLLYIFGFLINKKTDWIASLPRAQRTKYFWVLLLNLIIVIKILLEAGSEDSLVFGSFNYNYPLTISLLKISFSIYGVFLFRIFMSILAVMPTSVIVERKSSEINTLTYLNKVIAESANNDQQTLIDTVTNLALQACSAYGAWTEIYTGNGTIISSCVNVQPESIAEIHKKFMFDKYLTSFNKPHLFESVREAKELEPLIKYIPYAKSLIIVPLKTSTDREGTLIVFDSEDFALENDDLNILTAFGDNVKIALDNSRLLQESVEKERYRSEMMLARSMQQKLLPQNIIQPDNYSISAFSIPAMEVGGDYFDIVRLKSGNYCILIGDVSGKGISAAFYMAQLKGVVLSKAVESESAMELLCKINSILYRNMEIQMFITMSAVSINVSDNTVSMARAGHMPFLLKSGGEIHEYISKGIGIGLTNETLFNRNIEQINLKLCSGDTLIIYTDGLNEMRNSSGDEYGLDNLKKSILSISADNSDDLINGIKSNVQAFSGSEKNHDDMTIIAIMRL